jgi:hypothetical protein
MHKKTNLFFILALISTIVSIVVFVTMMFRVVGTEARIEEISNDLLTVKQQEEQTLALRNTSLALRDKTARIDSAFIRQADIPAFIEGLESKATVSGISSSTFSIDSITFDEQSKDIVRSLKVRMQGAGNWSETHGFVENVESIPVLSSIRGVMFSRINDTKLTEPQWRVFVDFETFIIE